VLIEQLQFVQKCLLVFLSLYCFRRYEHYIPTQVNRLADISFGIYLVHGIILEFLEHVIRHYHHRLAILEYSLLNLMLVVVLVNALTILVIKTIQWLFPRYSRYIIGC
jgi:peptidoglycan/LPS O-acetylase OafA/YrhL